MVFGFPVSVFFWTRTRWLIAKFSSLKQLQLLIVSWMEHLCKLNVKSYHEILKMPQVGPEMVGVGTEWPKKITFWTPALGARFCFQFDKILSSFRWIIYSLIQK